ncbi:hypothetical protein [Nocardioides jiangxiensis]|uniref:Lipoprotein n=1 Tax=Nocardioides jiangxiensis TaxID=3064524 RepID=A0ABT9AY64_9ACTN|nr:hypothetical protein [Nocardioides sp. WY-20]MDO7866894.1 hypothetical protein [Nocardioides sp. WY-20]
MTSRAARLALAGVLLTGCASEAAGEKDTGDGRLAMVSGRDDHGFVDLDRVPVRASESGGRITGAVVGRIHDGTLVRVVQRDHTAMRVTTLEGPSVTGWLDDFHLRGQFHLVGAPPLCGATIGSAHVDGGRQVLVYAVKDDRVLVETVPGGDGAAKPLRGWVARPELRELPPQGRTCAADPPGSKHVHDLPRP